MEKVEKSDEEWRKELSEEEYRITREKGTEPPFTGKYVDNKKKGMYRCICCGADLFDSDRKFDSGTGWPSFTKPVDGESVGQNEDRSHSMVRTEVVCKRCGAHLGHVFDDGPAGEKRFCINSASLKFKERE